MKPLEKGKQDWETTNIERNITSIALYSYLSRIVIQSIPQSYRYKSSQL